MLFLFAAKLCLTRDGSSRSRSGGGRDHSGGFGITVLQFFIQFIYIVFWGIKTFFYLGWKLFEIITEKVGEFLA